MSPTRPTASLLVPGRNCERIALARRVAWLVDGERAFAALADAIERAQRSLMMVGWDFHSRMRLRRGDDDEELVPFLERVVRRRPGLVVRILGWDFAMIYALEREFLPLERFQHRTHRRIHFRLDDRHPAGASHHQKIVVIDDAVAFCGGLDVTVCRWDTSEHRAADPRRSDPGFQDYGPFHDVQMLVDGDAARALGDVARERWRRATGHRVRPRGAGADPWPAGVEPQLRDLGVGIARTQPAYDHQPEVRHVERLHVDAIRAARHAIYLENQYLTSSAVVGALAERLGDADAPEVVVLLPRSLSGWLEEKTMGALMAHAAARLREADRYGRLRIYVPVLPGGAELTIHSKVAVVDDRLLRIGSANLSNRSMGLDTECDLAAEAVPGGDAARAILRFRNELLAEHLGSRPDAVQKAVEAHGSLVRGIDALCRGERRLEPFEAADAADAALLPPRALFDPEQPIPFEALREQLVEKTSLEAWSAGHAGVRGMLPTAAALLLPLGLLAAWQLTPLSASVSPDALAAAAHGFDERLAGPAIGLLVFMTSALLMVPVVSLIVACALVFGFVEGAGIALVGSLAAAAAGYALGRWTWRDAVRRLAGARLDRLNEHLSQRGVVATAVVRLLPVAPFAVVNLVAGASRVRLRDFLLGTALGMAPGTAALAFFGERALRAARDPSAGSIALTLLGVALLLALSVGMRHLLERAETGAGSVT